MAQVLRIAPTCDGPFSTGSIRRSNSQSSLFIDPPSASQHDGSESFARRYSSSLSSSAPSSPRFPSHDLSNFPSCASTPASSLSLRDQFCAEENEYLPLPSYDDESVEEDSEEEDLTPSNSPPKSSSALSDQPPNTNPSRRLSLTLQSVGDDLALEVQPSKHVDYLSHDWKEEELWSSWRHVVGKRRTIDNWERLENASWRTWAKSRSHLQTVSPETLNWMKDHDVTWLYGPLQNAKVPTIGVASPGLTGRLSRHDSFVSTKSILKKRSVSEVMLQRSLSNSTLVKQAVDSLVSQGPSVTRSRPALGNRGISEGSGIGRKPLPTPIESPLRTYQSSSSSSGAQTPGERRRIHFSEKVEQCIAINKDGDFDQDDQGKDFSRLYQDSDSESDDGVLMMKLEKGKERRLSSSRSGTSRPSFSNDASQRTIAMLPATKLRGDTPEPPNSPNIQVLNRCPRGTLTKSSSQETLKPSRPSSNFMVDDGVATTQANDRSPLGSRRNSTHATQANRSSSTPSLVDEDEEMQLKGLRRTPSGMFMPYDEHEEGHITGGILGKVVDTVNTVRDIAHVIWNVGYRR